jgi:MFS family permease
MAYSTSLIQLIITASLMAFGVTFITGALDALMYDYYPEKNREQRYTKVISKGNAIAAIAIALSTVIGGYLYTLDYKLPMLLTAISFAIAGIVSMFFTEKSVKKDITPEISFNVKQLFKEAQSPKIVLGH